MQHKIKPATNYGVIGDTNSVKDDCLNTFVQTIWGKLPENTELLGIETTEGVCFVNFTGGFIDGIQSGSYREKTLVYSVVNSLTRISGIDKVQILIDGKKPEEDKNQLFSVPLERNENILAEK